MKIYKNKSDVWRWADYYEQARKNYGSDSDGSDVYNLTIKVHDPYRSENPVFHTDEKYLNVIDRMHEKAKVLFQNPNVFVRQGMAYGLKDNWVMENELKDLVGILKPQLEEDVFHSHVHIDNVKIYRSFVTKEPCRSSWLWHVDNAPKEQIKILIYLTDVEEDDCGQFEFITDGKTTNGIKIPTGRVSWDNWIDPWEGVKAKFPVPGYDYSWAGTDRVPTSIVHALLNRDGCRLAKVRGKKGKLLLFDNNIMHRATTARKKHRDVVVFQIKPSLKPTEFSSETCGNGWNHTTFNVCPSIQTSLPATPEYNNKVQLEEIKKVMKG
jgi:hypothetical protein